MKGMKKLFALFAVLALALTLTPMVTANAQTSPITPITRIEISSVTWGTLKGFGLDTASTASVVQIKGRVVGVTTPTVSELEFKTPDDASSIPAQALINPSGDFELYVKYEDIWSAAKGDGLYLVRYADIAPAPVAINLGKYELKEAIPTEVTSGQEITITGTFTGIQSGLAIFPSASNWRIFVWRDGTATAINPVEFSQVDGTGTTATFSLTFKAYGDIGTKYYITGQPSTATAYNGAPYFTITVKKLADVTVNVTPETIVAGVDNDVTLQLLVGDVKLGRHAVTGTITLGSETVTFAGTTGAAGRITATGVKFNSVGVADVTVKVSGPDYYGTGSAKLNVSTSEEYGLAVKWPTTWEIGKANTVQFSTPYADYTVSSVKVKVSGPVDENGETLEGTSTIGLTPMGYGELTLQVEAILEKGTATTAISKTFSTTIPGYVATVDPEELVRGATQTLTVVVKDAYGNPVNNALVQFFSPANSSDPIAKVNGRTESVNNGTYELEIVGSKIAKADAKSYVEVLSGAKLQAKVFVEIARSPGINITLDKTEIVLGPKTTLTVTVASPEALAGATLKLVDADGENTGILAYTFTGAATVQKVTLPVNTMPEEAGVYQVVVESPNYQGSATLTFVEPVFTATPAELLANSSNVVTFTSTNVEDLRAVTSVTATGAVKSITAKIA